MGNKTLMFRSLLGTAVGDALGEQCFGIQDEDITNRRLPLAPWHYTDDTEMAISIVENLLAHCEIVQDALADAYAKRFIDGLLQSKRGYGRGASILLYKIHEGSSWREESAKLFDGGSYGNGGAMRAAPIGGYYAGEPGLAAQQAILSAEITHAHPEGQAGAAAVAVAASLAANEPKMSGNSLLETILKFVHDGAVKEGIKQALTIQKDDLAGAIEQLGTGYQISAMDTVPFCLWVAAHNMLNYEEAIWKTISGRGDIDTTCAIVGGIVALSAPHIPLKWIKKTEKLPEEFRMV